MKYFIDAEKINREHPLCIFFESDDMTLKIAINGFGRIGRLALRSLLETPREDFELVAINDLSSPEVCAHLLQYDSIHGPLGVTCKATKSGLKIGRNAIKVFTEKDPAALPWEKLGVDIVLECTGVFTSREAAALHLEAGAKKVLISAPGANADLTVVYGVNHDQLRKQHTIVSNASCTTNCLAPVAQVLHKTFGITRGYMTTVHAYTGDQRLVDATHKDLRRARAASQSIIPTTTGAAQAIGLVLPELASRLEGTALRVPVQNVSLIDLVVHTKKATSVDEINATMTKAAKTGLKGVLGVCNTPLVSSDFNHNPLSSIFDLSQTQMVNSRMARVLSWYDNEWGFANRMLDTAVRMGRKL